MSAAAQARKKKMFTLEERHIRIEARAKEAYTLFASIAGASVAFERLPQMELTAWREVVKFFDDDPACGRCGDNLACPDCDGA